MEENPCGTAGHTNCWKIFSATMKSSSMPVSVFLYDKEPIKKSPKKDPFLNILKQDIQLLKDFEHKYILKVVEVFEENRKMIGFVTERVVCSIENLVNVDPQLSNLPRPQLSPLEVSRGMYHLCEGLMYLHNARRVVHCNLIPSNVLLTSCGEMKIIGFGFSQQLPPDSSSIPSPFFSTPNSSLTNTPVEIKEEKRSSSSRFSFMSSKNVKEVVDLPITPNLSFSPPEITNVHPSDNNLNGTTDIFSLGMIMAWMFKWVHNHGGPSPPFLTMISQTPTEHQAVLFKCFNFFLNFVVVVFRLFNHFYLPNNKIFLNISQNLSWNM